MKYCWFSAANMILPLQQVQHSLDGYFILGLPLESRLTVSVLLEKWFRNHSSQRVALFIHH